MRKILIVAVISSPFLIAFGFYYLSLPPKIDRVIVIHLDTTRMDDIGSYSGLVETPNIDALASEGRRYTNSITTVPKTAPSIANFFTGLYARNNGVYLIGHGLQPEQRTLAEVLKDSGYKTVGYTANMSISDLGFVNRASTDDTMLENTQQLHYDQGFEEFRSYPPCSGTIKGTIEEIVQSSMRYADENKDSKFFMWMLVAEPHGPYTPPYAI